MTKAYGVEVSKNTLNILERARDVLQDEERWHKGGSHYGYSGKIDSVCLTRAVDLVTNGFESLPHAQTEFEYRRAKSRRGADRAVTVLNKAVMKLPNRNHYGAASFNDSPLTTHKDVMNLLNRVIRTVRKAVNAG